MKSRDVGGSIPLGGTILYRCGGIGIRAGFKNQWEFSLEGSSPSSGTNLSGCRRIGIANGFKPRVFGRGGSTPLTRTSLSPNSSVEESACLTSKRPQVRFLFRVPVLGAIG